MTSKFRRCQNCFRLLPRTRHHVNGRGDKINIMYLCRQCHDIYDFIAGKREIIFRPQHEICLRAIIQHEQRKMVRRRF
jgi:ubiquinone biosynthesis protein Coq4